MNSTIAFSMSMLIFGTIGALVRSIPLPAGEIALIRGFVGALTLLPILRMTGRPFPWKTVTRHLPLIVIAGAALAGNWICLFEAFKRTSIANATVSYYSAPVYLLLLSPILFHERLTLRKIVCVILTFTGMSLIAFGTRGAGSGQSLPLGLLFGFSAAVFYATLMILNRYLRDLSGLEATALQLVIASAVLLPYVAFTGRIVMPEGGITLCLLAILGIVNTGLGFFLFFSGMRGLPASSISVLSYLDPLTSVAISLVIFRERMTPGQAFGAALVLGSTLAAGIKFRERKA